MSVQKYFWLFFNNFLFRLSHTNHMPTFRRVIWLLCLQNKFLSNCGSNLNAKIKIFRKRTKHKDKTKVPLVCALSGTWKIFKYIFQVSFLFTSRKKWLHVLWQLPQLLACKYFSLTALNYCFLLLTCDIKLFSLRYKTTRINFRPTAEKNKDW